MDKTLKRKKHERFSAKISTLWPDATASISPSAWNAMDAMGRSVTINPVNALRARIQVTEQ